MACYCKGHVHYRGRLYGIDLRYCGPMDYAKWGLLAGKYFKLTRRDIRNLYRLLARQHRCPISEAEG